MFDLIVEAAIHAHAKEEYPREACGLVVANEYVPCQNIAVDPETNFRISPEEYLSNNNGIQAVVHSHPKGPNCPSQSDMEQQIASGLPWGICNLSNDMRCDLFWFGDQCEIAPLIGREFRHGVWDCWSAVRDWYRLRRTVLIDDCPRDDQWWANGKDFYLDGYLQRGFREVVIENIADLLEGDGFVVKIRSAVYNHGGLYIGNGLIYHHLYNRLSREEPIYPWWGRHSAKWLRYYGND